MSDERHTVWQWRPGSPHGVADKLKELPESLSESEERRARRATRVMAVLLAVFMVSSYVAMFGPQEVDASNDLGTAILWGAVLVAVGSFILLLSKVAEQLVHPAFRVGRVVAVSGVVLAAVVLIYRGMTGG